MHTVCICLFDCVVEISGVQHCISVHLFQVSRTTPGKVHKLLFELLTGTERGESVICVSLRFQCMTF